MEVDNQKYDIIINELKIINREVNELNKDIMLYKKNSKINITINEKGIDEELIDKTNSQLEEINNNIKYNIIPSLIRNKYN